MSGQIEIRVAVDADAGAISALNGFVQQIHASALPDLFPPPSGAAFTPAEVSALMQTPGHRFYLAWYEGQPAGYLYLVMRDLPGNALRYPLRTLNIDHICVHPDYRQRGIGERLIETARAVARLEGITRIELSVWAFNQNARRFFERQGFEPFIVRMWSRSQPPPVFGSLPPGQVAFARPGAYALILNEHGQVAVVQHRGGYLLPGGGIEPGELPEQALLREAREEIAVELGGLRFVLAVNEYLYSDAERRWFRIEGQYYRAEIEREIGGDCQSEHSLAWIPAEQALEALQRPGQAWALRCLLEPDAGREPHDWQD